MKRIIFLLFLTCFSVLVRAQEVKDTLKVGYSLAPPFIVQDGEALGGINIWLWEKVANDLGLEFVYRPMAFKDMLHALEIGSIDMSVNPLTITSERSKKMEFTDSFYASNSTIAIAEVSAFKKFKSFVSGFFNTNFLKGMLLLVFIIFLFGLAAWFFERGKNKEQFRTGYGGIWDGIWWSAVTLTTVGYGDKAPKSKMGKVTSLVLMFGGLLFISALTASIASGFTVHQLNSNPDSFNEFKGRKVGTVTNSSSNEFLKSHFFKDIRLYEGVVPGLSDLQNNKLDAFIYDEPILRYRIRQDSTLNKLSVLPVKFDVQFYAFALESGKIGLEQKISQRILEIKESMEWQIVLNEYGLTEI